MSRTICGCGREIRPASFEQVHDRRQTRDRVMVDGKLRVDNEVAARSRLRVDTRRWALSKLAPVKYGDKVTSVLEGGERPVEFAGMSEDQLRAWIVKEAQALGLGEALAVEVTATTDDTTPTDAQRSDGREQSRSAMRRG